ncbi:MAG: serine/threonine protein kinase [Candidatus Obscuribacterales bacterium]|nr:serine/threonine protein kinase [Candidatus Obscuribacterales bacterium]
MAETTTARKRKCLNCDREYQISEEVLVCPDDGDLLTPVVEDSLLNVLFDEKYLLLEVLGEGGYGRVYKARHLLMQKIVAVKVLLAELETLEALNRFEAEARATNQLTHPNIVAVFDYGVSPRPYMVMEYVEGETLDQLLAREGPLSVDRFVSLFDQICLGLSLAHGRQLLHRDLKPSNIIIDRHTGTPKILDFGVVKIFGEDRTLSGQTVGSPPYMSPEQCMGKELDASADVYSLGCVMYETLTGLRAFDGENAIECMYKHFNVTPAPIGTIRKEALPRGLDYLIARTMADYKDRYKNVEDLRADLQKVAQGTMSKRLPKISRVTYRKTVNVLATISLIGSWTIVVCALLIYLMNFL